MVGVLVNVLVPVFGIVAVGFVVARVIGAETRTLATLSYWILGPVFIFEILSTARLSPDVVLKIVVASLATMVVVGVIAYGLMRPFGATFSVGAATVLTATHGNVGNFGLAICAFAFGDEVLPIAGIVMVAVNTLGILVGVGLASVRNGSLLRAVGTAVGSPLALAVIPALWVNLTDATLPLWLARPVSLLAAAMIPVMLLTLGIQLAGMQARLPSPRLVVPVSLKLVAAPLVAVGFVTLLTLDGDPGRVVVLQAAMPAAVFTSLIALEHDLEADYVTSVVLVGTLLSAVTLPVVISLL
ncbi:MAG TPA: AEC family transporter [Acidimicrobiia bacterium]|nr:AEC family transporter [Acidimicrobiia bacterium]